MKERQYWIDGLKFIAIMGVFIAHYHNLFLFGSERAMTEISPFAIQLSRRLCFIIGGTRWICVFGILSGYLIGSKAFATIKETISAMLLRYIRFALTFFVVGLFIYFIAHTISFPSEEYQQILQSEELMYTYIDPIGLKDVLFMTFLFKSTIDGPLWMLGAFFIGNEISYVMSFIKTKLGHIVYFAVEIILTVFTIIYSKYNPIYIYFISTIVGDMLGTLSSLLTDRGLHNKGLFRKSNYYLIGLAVVGICYTFHGDLAKIINEHQSAFLFPGNNIYLTLVYAIFNVLFCAQSPVLNDISKKLFAGRFGKLSFPIYLLHVPIIYSFSLYSFGFLINRMNYTCAYYVNLVIAIAVVLIVSVFFSIFEENTIDKIMKRLKTAVS